MKNDASNIGPDWGLSATKGPWTYDARTKQVVLHGMQTISIGHRNIERHDNGQTRPGPSDAQQSLIAVIQGRGSIISGEELLKELSYLDVLPPKVMQDAIKALNIDSNDVPPQSLKPRFPVSAQPQPQPQPKPTPAPQKPTAPVEKVTPDSAAKDFTPAAAPNPEPEEPEEPKIEIPETAIRVGPFAYDEETDQIFFENKKTKERLEVMLSPTTHKILSAIIKKGGKPVSNIELEEILYNTNTGSKTINARIQTYRNKLKTDLEKQIGDGSKYFHHDLQGSRILPFASPVTLEKVRVNTYKLITFGPWSWDPRTEFLFFEDQLKSLRPEPYAAITDALKELPKPISTQKHPRLLDIAKEFNARPQRLYPEAGRIFYRCKALEDKESDEKFYVLDVSPYELDENRLDAMGILEFGPIMVSPLQGRIWVNGEPIEVYPKEWTAYSHALNKKLQAKDNGRAENSFTQSREIALTYNTNVNAVIDCFKSLRRKINKIEDGAGDTHLRAANGYGHIICTTDQDFRAALALAQSKKPRSRGHQDILNPDGNM